MPNIPNKELVEKAVHTTDLLAVQGKLNPIQSEKFIDYVIQETILKDNARVVRFRPETLEIDKIGIGRRVAVPKAEARDPGIRRTIATSKVDLTPKELMVPFEIGDTFKEVSIEGDNIEDTIIRLMATQLANDLEELYINGDVLGHAILEGDYMEGGDTTRHIQDAYLAMFNGWFRLGDSGHVVDAGGANVGLSVFGSMLRAMPTKFRRNKGNLRWLISPDLYQIYLEKVATRATQLGDLAAGGGLHKPFGVTPVEVPLLDFLPPIVKHVVLNTTVAASVSYGPIASVVVSKSTLGATPETAYIETTDYVVDYTNGTVARSGGGSAIGDGDTVKVTFTANPQILLTHMQNLIVGIGRDIRIEKDRDIFKTVSQYAISAKVSVQLEEVDALVKGINIGQGV